MSYKLMRRFEEDQKRTLVKSVELLALHLYISYEMIHFFAPDEFISSQLKIIDEYLRIDILKVNKQSDN